MSSIQTFHSDILAQTRQFLLALWHYVKYLSPTPTPHSTNIFTSPQTWTESAEITSPSKSFASSRERSVFPTDVVPAITSTAYSQQIHIIDAKFIAIIANRIIERVIILKLILLTSEQLIPTLYYNVMSSPLGFPLPPNAFLANCSAILNTLLNIESNRAARQLYYSMVWAWRWYSS